MSAAQTTTKTATRRRVTTRVVGVSILLVALLLAGVVSFYASSSPDGLNRVAEDQGFAQAEERHANGDSTFAGYETAEVEDERVSGGLAGVAGVLVVLVLSGGLALALRRRRET